MAENLLIANFCRTKQLKYIEIAVTEFDMNYNTAHDWLNNNTSHTSIDMDYSCNIH